MKEVFAITAVGVDDSSIPVHIDTPLLSYIPFIEWLLVIIIILIACTFLVRIGTSILKLLDLMIIEKTNKNKLLSEKNGKNEGT